MTEPGPRDEIGQAAEQLASAVETALPRWVERSVERILVAWRGAPGDEVMAEAREAGRRAAEEVGPEVRRLLAMDVDEQRENPLAILRRAVRYPTAVLRAAGVPPVERDEFDEQHFPDDEYALTPMSFVEIDESLHEAGIVWGAMKARVHLERRRAEPGS